MEHNVYVFPPFVLVGPLLRYFFDQRQCFAFTVIVPRLQRHRYFLLGRKVIRPYCFSLPAPPRISLLGLTMGSVRFSLYLLLVSCVYRSNAHGSLPTDVPPALIQTTVTRTFAKPAVNLNRVSQRKGPVHMHTCLWSTCKRFTEFQESFTNKPYERQKDSLEVQLLSFLRSLVPPKKFSAAIAEDVVKFLISMDAAGKQKHHVRSCFSKPEVALSVWRSELSIRI